MLDNTNQRTAYFSMEIGINSKIPTYSGGLGVLAGDLLKAAADISYPMVGVTLLNKHGYFFQDIKEGKQKELATSWSIDDFLEPLDSTVIVKIGGRDVIVGCWSIYLEGESGSKVPILFLHTDFPENSTEDRAITDKLYGKGHEYRLKQEIVLGIGGCRLLKELGFNSLETPSYE